MENEVLEFRKIHDRCSELQRWISVNAPKCLIEEKHRIEGSQERGYWAHGYLTALLDVQRLFARGISAPGFGDEDSTRKAA
ncbi:hypothetical protein DYQ86_11155 [Acidobacteria bacterium AB60]|nr:hypothetical protein DYQ86_11155 [Acidobacteria bacterium AB60]